MARGLELFWLSEQQTAIYMAVFYGDLKCAFDYPCREGSIGALQAKLGDSTRP